MKKLEIYKHIQLDIGNPNLHKLNPQLELETEDYFIQKQEEDAADAAVKQALGL